MNADAPERDVLRDSGTSGRVVRGGAIRGAGYAVGAVISAIAAILLLRYLGPVEFGQFSAVAALVGIMAGVTEAGLNSVGARDMALHPAGPERERILANLIGVRLLVTPVGVAIVVAVAWAIGFDSRLIWGTLIAGLGVILVSTQATMMLPLWVDLQMVRLTGVEVAKQAIALGGIAALVAAGSSLLPFFAVQVLVGVLILAITPMIVAGVRTMRPSLDRGVWMPLIREALPVAIAVTLNVIYFRVLMVEMEVLSTGDQTGYFATAFRLMEFLIALPLLMMSVALPVLSVANQEDLARLRSAVRALCEVSLAAGIALALIVGLAASPIVAVLGGQGYEPAAPAVQVQALTLIPLFLGQALQVAIIAARKQRLLVIANGTALIVVLVAGLVVIPSQGAVGASWVAVAGESLLVAILLTGAHFVEPGWLPSLGTAVKLAVSGGAALLLALLLPLGSDVAAAAAGVVAFISAALALGAVHPEVLRAFVPGRSGKP